MNGDPTPLQERIERILAEHPILPPTYAGDDPIARKRERTAARIAEEIAAEVRKAQADALREAAEAMGEWGKEAVVVAGDAFDEDTWVETSVTEWLTARAATIETEDQT